VYFLFNEHVLTQYNNVNGKDKATSVPKH